MPITVATIHGKDHAFFRENGGWSSPPLVIINSLAALDLCSQERHICLILLNHRYSLSMALMDLGELAAEFGKSIRQVQRWIKKLRDKALIKVTPRAGRPSIIDVSPLIVAVKKLVGWQEEQPAADDYAEEYFVDTRTAEEQRESIERTLAAAAALRMRQEAESKEQRKRKAATKETLADVAPEPEPTEDELFWLQAADSEEDAAEEKDDLAAEIWEDIKHELHPYVARVIRNNYLAHSGGVGWEGMTLLVEVENRDHLEKTKHYEAQATLLLLDRWNNVEGVKFQIRKKKPKQLGPLARLAVATVGV